jgi:serine/threonine protein kinase
MQQQMTLPMGTIIRSPGADSYVVEGVLGRGGFSAVYKVRDWRSQDLFALKERANPSSQERLNLAFEGELLMRLHHPSLPNVYRVFENIRHDRIYLLMDYIEGKDLETLRRMQPDLHFSLVFVIALLTPIVDAIIYLHAQKPPIVHRDIKPGNIIVPEKSADALLVDFGLAKEYIIDKTTNLFRYGTPGYAAPEQYGQGTDPRTDIYGLGATIYTLLTGIVPIDALTRSVNRFGSDPLVRADRACPTLSPSVGKVIERAMSLHSEGRFATIEEFWNALSAASTQSEAEEEAVSSAEQPAVITGPTNVKKLPLPLEKQKPQEHARAPVTWKLLMPVMLAIIFSGTVMGGFLLFTLLSHHPTPAPVVRRTGHIRASTPVHASTSKSVHGVCAASNALPGSIYPQLAPCYAGTISDIGVAGEKTALYLTEIKQQQGSISGHFQGLGFVGTFTGTISKNGSMQFVVRLTGRADTILFTGNTKYGGDITGSFTVYDKNGQPSLDEYGLWNAESYEGAISG